MQQQQGIGSTNGQLQTTGKSANFFNGTNHFSLFSFCGLTIHNNVPDIFKILDSNDNPTAKFQALKDLLIMAQQGSALVNFTLCKEMFKDIKQHLFQFDPDKKQ